MEEWIKIEDKLPELDISVLVFDEWETNEGESRQDIRVAYLSEFTTRKTNEGIKHYCEWGTEYRPFNVTHWMPLPEPPTK